MKRFLCITAVIILPLLLSAQKTYNDAQLRTNLSLKWVMSKKFTLVMEQQNRWTKNFSEYNRGSFDLGLQYKITKNFRVKADYVFIEKRTGRGFFTERHWYYVAVVLKHRINKLEFFYRNMLQVRHGTLNSEERNIVRLYDRNKLTIRHETTRRTSFYVAGEIYIPLNHPDFLGIDRYRAIAGTTIRTFKNQSVDFYFMYQSFLTRNKWFDQNYAYPTRLDRRDFIYGINYDITF